MVLHICNSAGMFSPDKCCFFTEKLSFSQITVQSEFCFFVCLPPNFVIAEIIGRDICEIIWAGLKEICLSGFVHTH